MPRFALLLASGAALVSGDSDVTTIKLGQDINYPPFAFIDEDGNLQGLGKDIADGMTALCEDLEIEVVQTLWKNCWDEDGEDGPKLGAELEDGSLDACTSFTHTRGIRNQFVDFSSGILNVNKAAGLLTMLVDGKPKVDGLSDLDGVTIVDVAGWAPTADTIAYVTNKCTRESYSPNYEMVFGSGNDASMQMLRDGDADVMFVYADQAQSFQCDSNGIGKSTGEPATWNCSLWEGFGTEYAYVQTGKFGYVYNGTTLALAKKGSGVVDKLNPCLWKFMETKEYHDICEKHDFLDSCYPNAYWTDKDKEVTHEYNMETNEHVGEDCSSGYCPCPLSSVGQF
mmetsp:Transcript_72884/g.128742  ORF Transcript_72884/g.128742 Transcript_72884/m.128742 type:complete len:340 (+) Transcript_72884:74-1093(+)